MASCDFETKSTCDIRRCGGWVYSTHPTTEPLCMAFRLPIWDAGKVALWHPPFPHLGIHDEGDTSELAEFFRWILDGGLIIAHNSAFEKAIWQNVMVPRYGWPAVPLDRWRCSAARAAAHALPRALGDACSALHLTVRKDEDGHRLMQKLTKPRKPRKAEVERWTAKHGNAPMPTLYYESAEWFDRLWAYCCQDVLAEEALSAVVPDLSPEETEIYLLDQVINQRGFQLDREAVETALALIESETTVLNRELQTLTGGAVERASQRLQLQMWFAQNGLDLPDTQAQTVTDALARTDVAPEVHRGLEILQSLGRASTAKYEAMQNWAGADWRVRGGLLYHGASTGRWSGAGVQPHNFPKGTIKLFKSSAGVEAGWELLKTRDRDAIVGEFGSVMLPLSAALRGSIIAAPGKTLFVADYASIEARVVLWLAEDEDGLNLFRRGEDPYCDMATDIYKRPITKADADERQLGKAVILGASYGLGASKFVDVAAMYGITITEEFSKEVITAYREKYWRVKQMWADQEAAAIQAVQRKGSKVVCGKVSWQKTGWYLYAILPSGRKLAYPNPKVKETETPWGVMKPTLSFMGVNTITRQWTAQRTYGGSIVENLTQAVARDIMAEALLRCEASKVYQPVGSVHDEIISEGYPLLGSTHEFEQLMTELPVWAVGCPIAAESWSGPRYRK